MKVFRRISDAKKYIHLQKNSTILITFVNFLLFDFTQLFGGSNPHKEERVVEEYDFIVVGAGSAGCVVANRLTEVRDWRVSNLFIISLLNRFVSAKDSISSCQSFLSIGWAGSSSSSKISPSLSPSDVPGYYYL